MSKWLEPWYKQTYFYSWPIRLISLTRLFFFIYSPLESLASLRVYFWFCLCLQALFSQHSKFCCVFHYAMTIKAFNSTNQIIWYFYTIFGFVNNLSEATYPSGHLFLIPLILSVGNKMCEMSHYLQWEVNRQYYSSNCEGNIAPIKQNALCDNSNINNAKAK